MSGEIPSIPGAVGLAWSDTGRILSQLPVPTLVAFAIIVVLGIIQEVLGAQPMPTGDVGVGSALLGLALAVVQTYLITPFFIAVSRFIVLGERTGGYPLAPERRQMRYFGWSILFVVIAIIAILIGTLLAILITSSTFGRFVIGAALVILLLYFFLRLAIFLPSIAVDAPGSTLGNAWDDTRGNSWSILAIILLVFVPLLVLALVLGFIGASIGFLGGSLFARILLAIFGGALTVIFSAFAAAVSARLYEWLAARVKQPA